MTNEIKLKKLMDYGFITESEQRRILSNLGKDSMLYIKKDIMAVLDRDIKDLERREVELEEEKTKIENDIAELDKKILSEQKTKAKSSGAIEYKAYLEFKKKNENSQKLILREMERLNRKSHEHIVELKDRIEQIIMRRIKAKLK